MDILLWLQEWYHKQCDGDWEHMYGAKIYNVDNPGWAVEVDLHETDLEEKVFDRIQYDKGDEDWLLCFVENGVFQGNGDSLKLFRILEIFENWAEQECLCSN